MGEQSLLDVWGPGYCCQQVVGESRYSDALRAAVVARNGRATGELMVEAVLVPEPANRHDSNAVAVTIDGRCVGYLPREDAPAYAAVLNPLARRGALARVPARLWWDGLHDGELFASVTLDIAPPEVMLPANSLPSGGVALPPGPAMQVAGEDAHLDVLTPLLGSRHVIAAWASLHEITERRPRSERQVVEVRIDAQRIGQLSPAMSEHLLALLRHVAGLGLVVCTRVHVRGNPLKAEATIYPTRTADLPQSWIADLGRSDADGERAAEQPAAVAPSPALPPPELPPPGWFPDPAGTGLRWWDGRAWTEHTRRPS